MKRIVLSLVIIAALSPAILQAKEKLNILSTIKPIHSLVSAVLGEIAVSEQIIPNHASPHHYSLKPSDLRRINNADLIFRIDPNLESFLTKILESLGEQKVISLARSSNLTLLAAKGNHDHEKHPSDEDEEAMGTLDYHLWLNPNNAIAMTNTILGALIKLAPEHKDQFIENTDQLIVSINKKNQEITQQLDSVKDTPFLVMHDAWQYFTTHYQLKQLGSISAQERLKPSAKALSEARDRIANSKIRCLLAEPNLKRKTLRVLTEDLDINITEIDPLGRNLSESKLAYPQLLQYTADKLLSCLKSK